MSLSTIKKEIQKVRKTVENIPRIMKFRGKRVVPHSEWQYGDWSKFPDSFSLLATMSNETPKDWLRDHYALLTQLQVPEYGNALCTTCAIYQAQSKKEELDRHIKYWEENGGKEAKEKLYRECSEQKASELRRQDAMRDAEWRLHNEIAGAENRTCNVINYFRCPYGDERKRLTENGSAAGELWKHIEWYNRHWNRSSTHEPAESENKWYHFGETSIVDVGGLDDILKALEDGRMEKIVEAHERYMKETGREIWAL